MVRKLKKGEFIVVNRLREGFIFKKMPDGSVRTVKFLGFRAPSGKFILPPGSTRKKVKKKKRKIKRRKR